MNTDNIDITDIHCFGFSLPKADCWLQLADKAYIAKNVRPDWQKIAKALDSNVETCYYRMASVSFKDLDTDIEYFVSFNNGTKRWILEIPDSPASAVDKDYAKDFFKSDKFKATCKRFSQIMDKATKTFNNFIKPRMEAGELIELDEIKTEAVLDMLADSVFTKNLRLGRAETK